MKKVLNLSVLNVVSLTIVIVGIVLTVLALTEKNNTRFAHELDVLHSQRLKSGDFVEGTIDEFLINQPDTPKETPSAIVYEAFDNGNPFLAYSLKTIDDKYILVQFNNEESINLARNLSTFLENGGIEFTGKIGKLHDDFSINYEWFADALNVESHSDVDNVVDSVYYINEFNYSDIDFYIFRGLIVLVFGVCLFFLNGGIKDLIQNKSADLINPSNEVLVNSFVKHRRVFEANQLEKMLDNEKKNLGLYESKLEAVNKKRNIGFVLIILAVFALFLNLHSVSAAMLILILLLLFYAIKLVFDAVINMQFELAYKVVSLFGIKTIRQDIVKCERNIEALEENLQ